MDGINTVDQAHRLLEQLEDLEKNLYKAGSNIDTVLGQVFSKTEKESFLNLCSQNNVNAEDINGVKKVIGTLRDSISSLPKLEIQIAVTPTEYIIKTIGRWVEQNTGGKKLLDIVVNKGLIGGAAVSFNGLYRDYSVKKMLDAHI